MREQSKYPYHMPCTLSPLGVVLPAQETGVPTMPVRSKHNHYHKDVSRYDYVDVYRVLTLFNVTDPCIQHAVKKLLVAGGRGAGKDIARDVQEAIDTMVRWQEMRQEEAHDRDDPLSNTATIGES